ncbi:AI-2E family transporter [Pseudaminobacter sp. 19-2017]|uniref:AI-2E family transporter n=1 Tax=Pseudaminobacter soli (ex Zhang et al. 2022) TaxID=2831468 RepID=A0A942I2L4_9HYPH|nr:AI-2E family transporter [Pseudaminobacter soli]MBS3648918.1 AI-2E family transporter [Pseudaminobacter soli]
MTVQNGVSGDDMPEPSRSEIELRRIRMVLIGVFLLALVYALYYGRDFFMPVMLSFMLALTLTPIVRLLRRQGVPEYLSATLLVFVSVAAIAIIGYLLSGPVLALINDAPSIGRKLSEKLSELRHPFERFIAVTNQVDQVTDTVSEPGVEKVVVAQPGIVSQAAGNLLSAGTTIAVTFVLSLFVLASGPLFYEKIIQSFGRLSEKKRALRIIYDVEQEVSRYLLTITLINAGLGVAIGLGLWAIGMPTPLLWGVSAMLLNFLPYIGAAANILLVGAISIVSFDTLYFALAAPAFVLLCNVLEGQFITPLVVGRRLEINAVSIFIAVAFWSWLWGFVGALLAVPILVVIKVFCDHFDSLRHVGNFLAAHQTLDEAETETLPETAPR